MPPNNGISIPMRIFIHSLAVFALRPRFAPGARTFSPLIKRKAGLTEEELDAAVDIIAAVDAGVVQSLNQRIKQRDKT
jgi:hypothetical protein